MNRSLSSIAAASMLENRFNFVMVDWTYYMNGQRDFENMPDFKHVKRDTITDSGFFEIFLLYICRLLQQLLLTSLGLFKWAGQHLNSIC